MSDSVSQLIEQVLAGDLEKYREIVRTFEADVFRLVAPALGNRSAAEDLVQEAFIAAYRRLDSFDNSQPFRPWLLGIASNLLRNEMKRQSRETARMKLYSQYFDAMTSETQTVQSDKLGEMLAQCRQRLAEVADAAIRGRYDEGLSLEALAERLERSVTGTRQLLYRTRLMLRDCIESQLRVEGGDS